MPELICMHKYVSRLRKTLTHSNNETVEQCMPCIGCIIFTHIRVYLYIQREKNWNIKEIQRSDRDVNQDNRQTGWE